MQYLNNNYCFSITTGYNCSSVNSVRDFAISNNIPNT